MGAGGTTHEIYQQRQTQTDNDGLFKPIEFAATQSTHREGQEACSEGFQSSALP